MNVDYLVKGSLLLLLILYLVGLVCWARGTFEEDEDGDIHDNARRY